MAFWSTIIGIQTLHSENRSVERSDKPSGSLAPETFRGYALPMVILVRLPRFLHKGNYKNFEIDKEGFAPATVEELLNSQGVH